MTTPLPTSPTPITTDGGGTTRSGTLPPRLKRRILWIVIIGAILSVITTLLSSRTPSTLFPVPPALTLTAPPNLTDDISSESLIAAIDESLRWAARQDSSRTLPFASVSATVADLVTTLEEFRAAVIRLGMTPELYRYVTDNFIFLSSTAPQVLFTGYYEAKLRGSRTRTSPYLYPLYRKPSDLLVVDLSAWSWLDVAGVKFPKTLRARLTPENRVVPYYSRAEIDYAGALAGRGLEAIWVDDPIDAFFLHIQGSGVVTLPDGTTQRVGYAEKNGQPYRAIGNALIERQILPPKEVSAQSIKAYLRGNPEQIQEILSYNPSYVFFDLRERGPLGSLGTVVTGNRSIATDANIFPHGALAFIETEKPIFDGNGNVSRWEKFGRFVLNQDTGGAIIGPGRVDLFTGFGEEAEATAGFMKQPGRLFFILKKTTAPAYR